MKKLAIVALALSCFVAFAGCSQRETAVWSWTQELEQSDIISAVPWGEGSTHGPLSSAETAELILLLHDLTRDDFVENRALSGSTPSFGLQIDTADQTLYINESISPNGSLEIRYGDKMWWIQSPDLFNFIEKHAGS